MILGLTFDNQSALQNPKTPDRWGKLQNIRKVWATITQEIWALQILNLPLYKENKGMASPIRTMMIVTDASQAGWGAHLGDAKISGSCGQGGGGGGGGGGCKTPYKHAGNEGGSDRAKEIHTAHHKPITV